MKPCAFSPAQAGWLFVFVVVTVCCSLVKVQALACTAQYQCAGVSADYNYVACVDHVCQCVSANGFTGSATAQDKCQCAAPRSVYWQSGSPYCLSYPQCAASEVAVDRTSILKAKATKVYQNLIYPTASQIISGQVSVSDLFAPNARGRIDPLGTFDSYATLTEYFYVLASTPQSRITAIDVTDLFGVGNEVFIRVNVLFEAWSGTRRYNLTQSGRYLFDDNDLIASTDLIIHNIGMATNLPASTRPTQIATLCTVLTVNPRTCPPELDPSGYYTNYTECVDYLTNQVPFGTFDQAFSNSVVCRFIHMLLTPIDPVTHCPHAGKTGGGKCVDVPYASYYLVNY